MTESVARIVPQDRCGLGDSYARGFESRRGDQAANRRRQPPLRARISQFALPYAKNQPPLGAQSVRAPAVSTLCSADLCSPVVRAAARRAVAPGAAVPKAAVHKQRDALLVPGKVRVSLDGHMPPPAAELVCSEESAHRLFGAPVARGADGCHESRAVSFGDSVAHSPKGGDDNAFFKPPWLPGLMRITVCACPRGSRSSFL